MSGTGKLSHTDARGFPRMVDVSGKPISARSAHAQSLVVFPQSLSKLLRDGDIETRKGPVIRTAIIAGVMAAKRTHELIPFCHPLGLERCTIDIEPDGEDSLLIDCRVSVHTRTGVEMEALTGASVAALTVYDMCKSLSHRIVIRDTRLVEKTGGKSDLATD